MCCGGGVRGRWGGGMKYDGGAGRDRDGQGVRRCAYSGERGNCVRERWEMVVEQFRGILVKEGCDGGVGR